MGGNVRKSRSQILVVVCRTGDAPQSSGDDDFRLCMMVHEDEVQSIFETAFIPRLKRDSYCYDTVDRHGRTAFNTRSEAIEETSSTKPVRIDARRESVKSVPLRDRSGRILIIDRNNFYAPQRERCLQPSLRHREIQRYGREFLRHPIPFNRSKIPAIDMGDLYIVLYTSIYVTLSCVQVRTCVTFDIPSMALRPEMLRPTVLPNQLSTIRTKPLPQRHRFAILCRSSRSCSST